MIAPLQLYFSWRTAVTQMQVGEAALLNRLCIIRLTARKLWRFFTTFLYFGQLSLDLAFHLFFM